MPSILVRRVTPSPRAAAADSPHMTDVRGPLAKSIVSTKRTLSLAAIPQNRVCCACRLNAVQTHRVVVRWMGRCRVVSLKRGDLASAGG